MLVVNRMTVLSGVGFCRNRQGIIFHLAGIERAAGGGIAVEAHGHPQARVALGNPRRNGDRTLDRLGAGAGPFEEFFAGVLEIPVPV